MTATLRASVTSSMPVPRPVTASGRPAGERGDQGRGRCGVADAHLARHQAAGTVRRRASPPPRHRHRARRSPSSTVMAGPSARSAVPAATLRTSSPGCSSRGAATPDIDHQHAGAVLPGQHVDGRAAGAEVGHHLGCDLLRPRRHPLGDDTVVAGEDGDGAGSRAAAAGSGRRCRRAVAPRTSSRPSAPGGFVRRRSSASASAMAAGSSGADASQRRRERTAHRRRRYPVRFGRSRSTVSGTFRP